MTETESTIISIVLETRGRLAEWSVGAHVVVDNPTHKDHGQHGWVFGFQVCAAPGGRIKASDDQGWVCPIVRLDTGPRAVLYVIPFDRLRLMGG